MSVKIEVFDGWGAIILNRPERKNAITGPLGLELAAGLRRLDEDESVQVILLHGSGGAFCSGLDIKEFNADPAPDWISEFPVIWRNAHRALFNCSKPIVGALERYAINGGAALAIACDYLVAGEQAFLQVGEVQQGMSAPYNLAWLRLRHSEAVAAQLAILGRRFTGAELVRLGIACEVVSDDAVLDRAHELAKQLAAYPDGALQRIKAGIRVYAEPDADKWFDMVTSKVSGSTAKPRRQSG